MADLGLAFDAIVLPRPARFAEPESEQTVRARKLAELVWSRIPRHLVSQPCRPEYRSLVELFDWQSSWVLLGKTGVGKSTACVHLVRELLRRGRDNGGRDFVRAKSIFWSRADAITKAGGRDDEEGHKLLHRAEYAQLMILDDLAAPSKTMLGVIQQRYDAKRPIVVTSGAQTPREFTELVGGDAVTRWILECGGVRKGTFLVGGVRE
jgi:DNA replication protein DnaC